MQEYNTVIVIVMTNLCEIDKFGNHTVLGCPRVEKIPSNLLGFFVGPCSLCVPPVVALASIAGHC